MLQDEMSNEKMYFNFVVSLFTFLQLRG